jgi:multisubunit Na+/H+ antiporter MnhG subunit
MAHAAPRSGRRHTPATRSGTAVAVRRPPDVFDERAHAVGRLAIPGAIGLVYGYWAAAIRRDAGPITGWNVLFGFVCAIVFAAVCSGLLVAAPHLRRELHATLWAAFAGTAIGFLYSQTGDTVLRSIAISLAVAVGVFAFTFYRYYTHEDAEGHRIA